MSNDVQRGILYNVLFYDAKSFSNFFLVQPDRNFFLTHITLYLPIEDINNNRISFFSPYFVFMYYKVLQHATWMRNKRSKYKVCNTKNT